MNDYSRNSETATVEQLPEFGRPTQGALHMHNLGFKILPLHANSKVACVTGWPEFSLKLDIPTIENIYNADQMGEPYNFGIHPGPTGHFVLDIDCGNGKKGRESLDALQESNGVLPPTLTVRTASGGLHKYFKGAGSNTVGTLGLNLDSKGMNGYVVAPGSIVDGKRYEIVDASAIADAPTWLITALKPKPSQILDRPAIAEPDKVDHTAAALAYLENAEPCVEGDGGDAQLYKIFCGVRERGVTADNARELVLAHYNDRCEPPWDMSDENDAEHFERKLQNAYKYGQNNLGAKTEEAALAQCEKDFKPVPIVPLATPIPEDMTTLDAKLEAGAFSLSNPPLRTEPVLWIGDVGIAKPGDLVVLQAKVKAGKSAVVAAMMGCMIGLPDRGHDFLGFRGANPKAFPVLHLDTEQSREDHHDLITRTLARAGVDKPPAWFHSYCVTHLTMSERIKALVYKAESLFKQHGGMCAIFLDGFGDLCKNLNDETEANNLVDNLYRLAAKYCCPLVGVLHENHSSETGKTRGHLGSQLERKAASNLRLEKDGKTGKTELWGEKLRRGHIAKGKGPTFIWNDAKGMHTSCETAREVEASEAEATFGTQKAECLEFLSRHVKLGKVSAADLNEIAAKEGRSFAATSATKRFVGKITKFLEGTTEFRITQTRENAPWYVERTPSDFLN